MFIKFRHPLLPGVACRQCDRCLLWEDYNQGDRQQMRRIYQEASPNTIEAKHRDVMTRINEAFVRKCCDIQYIRDDSGNPCNMVWIFLKINLRKWRY